MDLLQAATGLSDVANAPNATYEDAMEAARLVLDAIEGHREQLNGALRVLLAAVRAEDDERAGIAAIVAGSLIEKGAEAELGAEHIVERFTDVVRTTRRYIDMCRDYFENEVQSEDAVCEICGPEDDETAIMDPSVRSVVAQQYPAGEAAWIALDLFCRPTVSVLSRDADARRRMGRKTELVNDIGRLAIHQPGAYFVWALLSLLEDELLLVLDPAAGLGWDVRMRGVADNFQLHLLLASALYGGGHLDGEPPEPHVVEVVDGSGPQLLDEHVMGYWNLFNWTALAPDGSLPDGYFNSGSAHWIPNEGVPADISVLEGRRVILLAPTPVIRQWRPARLFDALPASLTVERVLENAEVDGWLARIAQERELRSGAQRGDSARS